MKPAVLVLQPLSPARQAELESLYEVHPAGELPPDQCLPEVWLIHDEQETQARAVLQDMEA